MNEHQTWEWLTTHPYQRVIVPVLQENYTYSSAPHPDPNTFNVAEYWWNPQESRLYASHGANQIRGWLEPGYSDRILSRAIEQMVKEVTEGANVLQKTEPTLTGVTLDELFEQDADD